MAKTTFRRSFSLDLPIDAELQATARRQHRAASDVLRDILQSWSSQQAEFRLQVEREKEIARMRELNPARLAEYEMEDDPELLIAAAAYLLVNDKSRRAENEPTLIAA